MSEKAIEPKSIDFTQRNFVANGNNYYISDKISVARWKEYEKLSPRLTYGIGFDEMFKTLGKAYSALNDKKFADAAVLIHNLMSGVKDANDEKRVHPSLLMCALVINREGEDVGVYDHGVQISKIEDWQKEGLDILSFFAFALRSINGFRETYLSLIQKQAEGIVNQNKNQEN